MGSKKMERLVIYAPKGVVRALEAGRLRTAFPSLSSYALSLLLESLPEEARPGGRRVT